MVQIVVCILAVLTLVLDIMYIITANVIFLVASTGVTILAFCAIFRSNKTGDGSLS